MNRGKEIRNCRVCTTTYDYFRVAGMVRMGQELWVMNVKKQAGVRS